MRIRTLGPLHVDEAHIRGACLRALLIRLALEPGRVVAAGRLVDDLWEEPPVNPVAALHSLVSRLRRKPHRDLHKGLRGAVVSHPAGYLLDVPAREVDAAEFDRLVRAGRAERDPGRAAASLRAALSLWRGAPLADAADLPFARVAAARLEELRDPPHGRGRTGAARTGERAGAGDEPGRQAGGRGTGAEPAVGRAAGHADRAGRRGQDQAGGGGGGRARRVLERLAGRACRRRGPGGRGRRGGRDHTGGRARAGRGSCRAAAASPLGALVEALAGRELVLVLDNCEHVVDGAAAFAQRLLSGVPGLRILATSREPLDVPGEHLHPVRPLALPAGGVDAARALEFPAVAFFAERASAVRPGFAVDDSVVADVVALCRDLDGLPLAIELAAARLRSFTMRQRAEAMGVRLTLRGSRTAEPRHRTLWAVIDWSWGLLSPGERVVLRRLSVFAGGATAEAVRRVCGADPETVASLVDKSLVVVTEPGGSSVQAAKVRYRLLETVRAYAAGRLEEAEPGLRTGEQLRLLATLDAEPGDLDAALGHAVRAGRERVALRLFMARLWAWTVRGRGDEAARWARAIRAALGGDVPPGLELPAMVCALPASGGPYASPEALRAVEETGLPAQFLATVHVELARVRGSGVTASRRGGRCGRRWSCRGSRVTRRCGRWCSRRWRSGAPGGDLSRAALLAGAARTLRGLDGARARGSWGQGS
ncbi:BTAD domain-containing putative transcriptional regulator [Microbispora sp. H10836]|uniref:AfsR/SARP family transcriptional regulator n=1 Tax=Microbispora sp. H10836 TaxID=2729106 RepID=UPI001475B0D4|nr:BTAD domain-containing putative transcriptional regulator [Microbispora sp. H10836]